MRLARLIPLAAVALLAAACSTGGAASAVPASAAPASAPASSAASAPPAAEATRIEVTLLDALKIEPASLTVPVAVPVTFVVTNTGTILHEFVLGDETEQMAHDKEMADAGGMSMPQDEPNAIGVEPGETKELTFTFDEAGTTFAGCHVVGHYAGGMKAAITIQ